MGTGERLTAQGQRGVWTALSGNPLGFRRVEEAIVSGFESRRSVRKMQVELARAKGGADARAEKLSCVPCSSRGKIAHDQTKRS
jgi:hypothetical protein